MGTYAITINNYSDRLQEMNNRLTAVSNTYSAGNQYRNQELVELESSDPAPSIPANGAITYDVIRKVHYLISWQGGGDSDLYSLADDSDTWNKVKDVNNHPKVTGNGTSWVYSTKLDRYYTMSAGIGEYDNTFTPTSRGYGFATSGSSMVYDSKRNYIVTAGPRFDGVLGQWITQLKLDADEVNEIAPFGLQLDRNYIYETTINRVKFLNYSTNDDMYYYSDENKILKVNPTTGAGQIIITKGTDIVGLLIEEGSSRGYYAYVDGDDVKVTRFDLANPATVYPEVNLGDIESFVFLYVGKTVLLNCRVNSVLPWYTVCYNADLTLNLTYEKNIYHVTTGTTTVASAVMHQMLSSTHSSKRYRTQIVPQNFRPLSGDQIDVHIPAWIGGAVSPAEITSYMQNINPVTAYPVVTSPTETDCCLDELKCEINTKLAKKSCEATNRAIVGRHYGNMFSDSELLEALLWTTTFDCLTCDDIEKLRCITSKI